MKTGEILEPTRVSGYAGKTIALLGACLPIVLAGFWLLGSYATMLRQRFISRILAEEDYEANRKWGGVYIRTHYYRYETVQGQITRIVVLMEPVVWGVLGVLFWILLTKT